MITYIIKFVLCSGVMLGIYHLLLSREAMYRFNRFYLLFALVFSAIAPLISVNMPYQVTEVVSKVTEVTGAARPMITDPEGLTGPQSSNSATVDRPSQPTINFDYKTNLPIIIYALVAAGLLFRFVQTTIRMRTIWDKGNRVKHGNTTLVLLDDNVTPHSFLNNIYIGKSDFESGIDPQIICHEQAHIKQLHSVDIIVIELLQIICWFNPFIPLYRRAIKLNHEFLADEAVMKRFDDTPQYQMLLLAKATQGSALYLTSQFNYLTIKKRLIMMTKTTSHKKAAIKMLIMLPVLAATIFLFSEKIIAKPLSAINNIVIKKPQTDSLQDKFIEALKKRSLFFKLTTKHSPTDAPAEVLDKYNAILNRNGITMTGKKSVKEIASTDTAQLRMLFEQMSEEQQKIQFVQFLGPARAMKQNRKQVTEQQLRDWQADAKKYGVFVDDKRIKNADLAKYKPSDFTHYFFSKLYRNAKKNSGFDFQVSLLTNAYSDAQHAKHLKGVIESNKKPRMHQLQLVGDKIIGHGNF